MNKKEVKEKINFDKLAKGLSLDPIVLDMLVGSIFNLWHQLDEYPGFSCIDGCKDCCSNAAITCSTLEWEIMQTVLKETPNNGLGCPYKTKKGCSIYEYRPLVCRLFGYVVPYQFPVVRIREELAGEIFDWVVITPGYCLRKKMLTPIPSPVMADIMTKYKEIIDLTSIVIAGTFKERDLNKGLATIDKFWTTKKNMSIWHKG